jgi:hypothetical protein
MSVKTKPIPWRAADKLKWDSIAAVWAAADAQLDEVLDSDGSTDTSGNSWTEYVRGRLKNIKAAAIDKADTVNRNKAEYRREIRQRIADAMAKSEAFAQRGLHILEHIERDQAAAGGHFGGKLGRLWMAVQRQMDEAQGHYQELPRAYQIGREKCDVSGRKRPGRRRRCEPSNDGECANEFDYSQLNRLKACRLIQGILTRDTAYHTQEALDQFPQVTNETDACRLAAEKLKEDVPKVCDWWNKYKLSDILTDSQIIQSAVDAVESRIASGEREGIAMATVVEAMRGPAGLNGLHLPTADTIQLRGWLDQHRKSQGHAGAVTS